MNTKKGVAPKLKIANGKLCVEFDGNLFKQPKIHYNHGKIITAYVTYEITKIPSDTTLTVQNALFGAVKLTKNVDISKYGYSRYGIAFDSGTSFSFGDNLEAKNVIILVVRLLMKIYQIFMF